MTAPDTSLVTSLDVTGPDLAQAVVARHYAQDPRLERYGDRGRALCVRDTEHHLKYLRTALTVGRPEVFIEYVRWVAEVLTAREVPTDDLAGNLAILGAILGERFGSEATAAMRLVENACAQLVDDPGASTAEVDAATRPFAELQTAYQASLLDGERREASRLVMDAVEGGISVRDVYLHVFQYTQRELGRLWERDAITVAQEHYCTAATQLIMSQLYPRIFAEKKTGHVLVATCVSGDLHEIGVRMVADFFEMSGWKTHYLGANTPAASVIDAILTRGADVLAISATITAHLDQVIELVSAVRAHPLASAARIIVGGYPFNQDTQLWRQVGADGHARDAEQAVELGAALVASA